ncbi:hypothetical protein [Muricoccus radiodurans]|uniref:hypothetical protein n=1 Tax=Muricoccus radiodurans TaxID=2231721 RepID=UPI003CEB26EA
MIQRSFDMIEQATALIDAIDGDADAEPDSEGEPEPDEASAQPATLAADRVRARCGRALA